MKTQKGFISFVIILIVAVGIGGSYLYFKDKKIIPVVSENESNKPASTTINNKTKVSLSTSTNKVVTVATTTKSNTRTIIIPAEFNSTGQDQKVIVTRLFGFPITGNKSTPEERKDREIFWKDSLVFIKNKITCDGTSCVEVSLAQTGMCGSYYAKARVKDIYATSGPTIYNTVIGCYTSEFPNMTTCD